MHVHMHVCIRMYPARSIPGEVCLRFDEERKDFRGGESIITSGTEVPSILNVVKHCGYSPCIYLMHTTYGKYHTHTHTQESFLIDFQFRLPVALFNKDVIWLIISKLEASEILSYDNKCVCLRNTTGGTKWCL